MAHARIEHADDAAVFIANQERTHWHDQALWFVRAKRDKAAHAVPEWEQLRSLAGQIKRHTLARLADYLEQFEQQAIRRGIHVHWARTADEHNRIVLDILSRHQVRKVVKSKSMLTEECHLNPFLERHGIEVVDTDLGERIVQLREEPPSHIVLPAIHIKKAEVGETFHKHLGTEKGATDPKYLTEAARGHLRSKFMAADAGITGVNFAVAETGGIVVCTNEGNADIGISLPPLHIACMGIEKLIPRWIGSGRLHAVAGPQRHGPADYHVHVALPRSGPGRGTALRARRQRPLYAPRRRALSRVAVLHSLWCVSQYVSGLSAQRRVQLPRDHSGPDRLRAQCGAAIPRPFIRSPTRAACADRVPMCAR